MSRRVLMLVVLHPALLLERILRGDVANVDLIDAQRLLERSGSRSSESTGSHHVYAHPGILSSSTCWRHTSSAGSVRVTECGGVLIPLLHPYAPVRRVVQRDHDYVLTSLSPRVRQRGDVTGNITFVLTVESVEGGYKSERLAAARPRGVVVIHGAVGDRGSA